MDIGDQQRVIIVEEELGLEDEPTPEEWPPPLEAEPDRS
jgi:hypothetical protein